MSNSGYNTIEVTKTGYEQKPCLFPPQNLDIELPRWLGFSCIYEVVNAVLEPTIALNNQPASLTRDHLRTHKLKIDTTRCIRVTELMHPDEDPDISMVSFGYNDRTKRPQLAIHFPLPWLIGPQQKNTWTLKYITRQPRAYVVYDFGLDKTQEIGQKAAEILNYYS